MTTRHSIFENLLAVLLAALLLPACAGRAGEDSTAGSFTIAVIPDTQNYLDYRHQRSEGFALDGQALFIQQMRDIAGRPEVVFVAAVGDVWQHGSLQVDPAHAARGIGAIDNPLLQSAIAPTPETRRVEIPGAVEGYRILSRSGKPFGVAPGNHDYDAVWRTGSSSPSLDPTGALHVGGLDNFRSVFGNQGEFFNRRDWYVNSFRGGANSAQVFAAGGYRFLHLALEMSPDDNVVRWAEDVIGQYPGYPTIITTHDYLNTRGERRANPIIDLAAVDPGHHNSAEQLWDKLVSAWDQIFLVLCGHHHGQSLRIDRNRYGNPVYQILADYQGRGQAALDAGAGIPPGRRHPIGLGDGWYRLMRFDLDPAAPSLRVETWSSHYRAYASELPTYAAWYRDYEQPGMTDAAFLATDSFTLDLGGFHERFHRQAP